MKIPFEAGGRYRNRNGAYEVLSLEGEHMTILYDSGRVQTVNIVVQARIWDNIQIDEALPKVKPGRVGADDEGLDSWPIKELVQEVLRTFKAPYPADVIDQVCLAIENKPEWLTRYHELVRHFSSQGKYGKLTVNSSIGWFTKDLTGMVKLKEGNPAKSTLLESYSTLGNAKNE